MKIRKPLFVTLLAFCLSFGLASAATAKPIVFVSIVPQKYFVEQIAGDLVDTQVLVAPGANPHSYEPTSSQMVGLTKAKAYFTIGISLEQAWLPRINGTVPSLRIVHTHRGIKKIPMAAHSHHDEEGHHDHDDHAKAHEEHHDHEAHAAKHEEHHDHGHAHGHEGHHHDHGTLDPHVWLDPVLVKTIATNTCKGLIKADPQNKATYEANLTVFLADLDKTHAAIKAIIDEVPADHRSFLVFHPSWGYFAERYGLTQTPVEVEGREPSPKALAEIVGHAKEKGTKVIFVQPQISQRTAKVIAKEIGAEIMILDPLAKDWKANLMEAAQVFKKVAH